MDPLKIRLQELVAKLNIAKKKERVADIEKQSSDPQFWSNQKESTKVMKELSRLNKQIKQVEELDILIDLHELKEAEQQIEQLEYDLYFSGPHDELGCILSIHAGQGGTEAMDWASMLFRMYLRYCEIQGWKYDMIDEVPGDEAGIKSAVLSIPEPLAYGQLKAERGVHRLVRQSPFNADKLRQTSFALIEVLPIFEDTEEVEIKDGDVEWEFFRSGGKGGQNVNKVATAVRVKHKATGLIVECQEQRYQGQNRETALKILRGKLWQMMEEQKVKDISQLKGEHKMASWGNQIRSYVLHPYHLVKDLRTDYETSDTKGVLDGNIQPFILSYLKKFSTGV